jgi:hypothetical protein
VGALLSLWYGTTQIQLGIRDHSMTKHSRKIREYYLLAVNTERNFDVSHILQQSPISDPKQVILVSPPHWPLVEIIVGERPAAVVVGLFERESRASDGHKSITRPSGLQISARMGQ